MRITSPRSRLAPRRARKGARAAPRTVLLAAAAAALALLTLACVRGAQRAADGVAERGAAVEDRVAAAGRAADAAAAVPVAAPQLPRLRAANARRRVFLLPGRENRCAYRYDYVCKFWFYIRCYVFASFADVRVVQGEVGARQAAEFMRRAREGDVAVVIWRSKNHSEVPQALAALLAWRQQGGVAERRLPRVRIGVLHIANEVAREDWPWYALPDFVVRNYWIPNLPRHVAYVPLGPQMPQSCTPRDTRRPWFLAKKEPLCECAGLRFQRASTRPYVWNFSGSLRKRRGLLLRGLRKSWRLAERGYVQVSKKFGGDGVFGSVRNNPKNAYLESILQSQFVFAPCGNAMETHRIYEALSLGAIPVIENCDPEASHFFPFRQLVIDGGPDEMIAFVERFLGKPEELDAFQRRVTAWWHAYVSRVARNVSEVVVSHVAPPLKIAP